MLKELLFISCIICEFKNLKSELLFEFPNSYVSINENHQKYLENITPLEWEDFIKLGDESFKNQERLELNLLLSEIIVQNGSASHRETLDSLPNEEARKDSKTATKILKASLQMFNSKCVPEHIRVEQCVEFLNRKKLPPSSDWLGECNEILESRRNGHQAFRRLLRPHYQDGLFKMFLDLPEPRVISSKIFSLQSTNKMFDENHKSLIIVAWTQFIEHDLSKPVSFSMSNAESIDCCGKHNDKLHPRHSHPMCAPLLLKHEVNKYYPESCLNYVRSGLAIDSKCTFGNVEQLNQATGQLDLSQLYGFTDRAQHSMRLFSDGLLKSTRNMKIERSLLPKATTMANQFCAFNSTENTLCFMAGDSRVNSNPIVISIYTLFLRNHNRLANIFKSKHPDWSDQQLFSEAKSVNVAVYRGIIFKEWLPAVLGPSIAEYINTQGHTETERRKPNINVQTSNEFGVAAIRFYFSMMPEALNRFHSSGGSTNPKPISGVTSSIKDQYYKPDQQFSSQKLDNILYSLLHQTPEKLDIQYEKAYITEKASVQPTHFDILALDIQRGRDHGLQKYVKYLEICEHTKINHWSDLRRYIMQEDIMKLRSAYRTHLDIDLIVGGIAEIPRGSSLVGPTFNCIIREQFSKIKLGHISEIEGHQSYMDEVVELANMDGYSLICQNSELLDVTKNIFELPSENNECKPCVRN